MTSVERLLFQVFRLPDLVLTKSGVFPARVILAMEVRDESSVSIIEPNDSDVRLLVFNLGPQRFAVKPGHSNPTPRAAIKSSACLKEKA